MTRQLNTAAGFPANCGVSHHCLQIVQNFVALMISRDAISLIAEMPA